MDLMIPVVIQGLFMQFRFVVLGVSSLQVLSNAEGNTLENSSKHSSVFSVVSSCSARVSMKFCGLFPL